jgi:hypothetical protein
VRIGLEGAAIPAAEVGRRGVRALEEVGQHPVRVLRGGDDLVREQEFAARVVDQVANDVVALLRAEAGRDPYDRQLSDLIGELSTRGNEFRRRWGAHHVRIHTTGAKRLHHPVVGDLDLSFESFLLAADPGQSLLTYTAEPGSVTQDSLNLLASWAATVDNLEQPASTNNSEQADSIETRD